MKVLSGISPIVFHATTLDRAFKILKSNQFLLVHSGFSQAETEISKKGREYFISTARNRHSDYVMRNGQVIFTLDGQKLAQRYKGAAVDFWGEEYRTTGINKFEQEDRIFSSTPKIPNAISYIKEISVLKRDDMRPWYAHNLYGILEIATEHRIPIHIYDNKAAYIAGNKNRAVNMQDFLDSLSKFMAIPENKFEDVVDRDYEVDEVIGYVNFFKVTEFMLRHELTSYDDAMTSLGITEKKDRDKAYTAYRRMAYPNDFTSQLAAAVQNARSNLSEKFADAMYELTKVMRKYKATTFKDLYKAADNLWNQLRDIERKQRLARSTQKFMEDMRNVGFTFKTQYEVQDVLKNLTLEDLKFVGSELTEQALINFVKLLMRVDNIGFYDIFYLKIVITDHVHEKIIAEFLSNLGFVYYGSSEYSMDYSKFHTKVYDTYFKNTTTAKIKVLTNDSEHWDTLHKTGFWGKRGAGCIFLSKKTNRLLIAHRSKEVEQPGTWGTWGGALDGQETFDQGMKREIKEETGYSGHYELIPLYLFKHATGFQYQNYLAVVENEFTPKMDWENQGFKWVDFGDWPKPMHQGFKLLIQDKDSLEKINSMLEM